jgi:hypothetical protein
MRTTLIRRAGATTVALATLLMAGPVARATTHDAPRVSGPGAPAAPATAYDAPRVPGPGAPSAPASSGLSVWTGTRWLEFWSAGRAPTQWQAGHPAVLRAIGWQEVARGIEVGELRVSAARSARRLRVVLVRIDPRHVDLTLMSATRDAGLLGAWTIDSMPADAHVAVNAGQFDGGATWGWHVENGRELQRPGYGPLAMAVIVDSAGRVRLLQGVEVETARARGGIATAFQSYPAVLVDDGTVPAQLFAPGRGVDVAHRDARLGLGIQRDGRLVIALTRFAALGETGGQMPFGPTTPEMAALMGAVGCSRAVLLDGGLSAQLAVRSGDGTLRSWPGLRRVPLGLVATSRQF